MSNFQTYRHKSYDGGLNNTASKREIERDEASYLENWDITYHGRLISRKGLTQIGGDLTNVLSLGNYKQKAGTNYLLCQADDDIYYLSGSTWTGIGDAGAAEAMSFQNVIVSDKIYLSSENNGLFSWNGTGNIASVGSSISGNKILWYQNHLFHINNVNVSSTKYSNRIYWSDFGNPEAYTTGTSFVDLPGEGKAVTMNVLGDSLVIFKENSYMFLSGYGASSWAISASATSIANVDSSVGCVAINGTVRVSANELWFIDNQGYIRKITQSDYGYQSKVMSNKMEGSRSELDLSKLNNAIAWYDDDKIYFALTKTGATSNNVVWVFDRKASARNNGDEAWVKYTGWTIKALTSYSSGVSPTLYVANTTNIFSHTGASDDGTAIVCRWDGKDDDYDQPERYKKYTYGYAYSAAQGSDDLLIYASVDGKAAAKIDTFDVNSTGTALGPTGPAKMGPTGSFILGGNLDLEAKYYFYDGGGQITGKTVMMSIRGSFTSQTYINTFTNHFAIRSLK